eukprot:3637827-Prorocentrum_lima.AAC.1
MGDAGRHSMNGSHSRLASVVLSIVEASPGLPELFVCCIATEAAAAVAGAWSFARMGAAVSSASS